MTRLLRAGVPEPRGAWGRRLRLEAEEAAYRADAFETKVARDCFRAALKKRNEEIYHAWRRGEILRVIAARYGITRERVRQIALRRGDIQQQRAQQEWDASDRAALAEMGIPREHGARYLAAVCADLANNLDHSRYPDRFVNFLWSTLRN